MTINKINLKRIILTSIMILNSNNLYGAIGCMDDSYHTKQKNDPKTYHYVKCSCPCHKYAASFVRGKCPQCGHCHDPKDFNVMTYTELKKKFNLGKKKVATDYNKTDTNSVDINS